VIKLQKWYEKTEADTGVVISSRVRLARNLADVPFSVRMDSSNSDDVVQRVKHSAISEQTALAIQPHHMQFLDLAHIPNWDLNVLVERHIISPNMVDGKHYLRGLVYNETEDLSVMINEEDHIRIQSIFVGQDLDAAYEAANRLDDALAVSLNYAFDAKFGFLTSCPTNTGTGLRASCMLHLPLLESTGQLKSLADMIVKTGFVIRGANGEGSDPLGNIYQVSNQITLGKTENEILNSLKQLVNQIVDRETALRVRVLKDMNTEAADRIWRAYGILCNARKMTLKEATGLLSDIRAGQIMGIIEKPITKKTIYEIITNIQPYNLQRIMGVANDTRHLEALRADYLRQTFVN